MKYRIIVPGAAAFIPKAEFANEWAVQFYIRAVLGDVQVPGIKIKVIK